MKNYELGIGSRGNGFSIIELLIVLGVLAVLAALTISSLYSFRGSSDADLALREVLGTLRLAQSLTLASHTRYQYGVHFQTDRIVLFRGASYDSSTTTNETTMLPSGISASTVSFTGGGSDVIFGRLTGTTTQSGTVTLAGENQTRIVTVDSSGEVRAEANVLTLAGSRFTDTRHVYFQLGWSIQNASTLQLTFFDPPNPNVIQGVSLSSICAGSPWNICDWSGTVAVNGSNQILRIHTITMSSSNTLLSVDRDRRTNTKTLKVSVIDGGIVKDIVTYTSTGTTTLGAYGGTMAIQ